MYSSKSEKDKKNKKNKKNKKSKMKAKKDEKQGRPEFSKVEETIGYDVQSYEYGYDEDDEEYYIIARMKRRMPRNAMNTMTGYMCHDATQVLLSMDLGYSQMKFANVVQLLPTRLELENIQFLDEENLNRERPFTENDVIYDLRFTVTESDFQRFLRSPTTACLVKMENCGENPAEKLNQQLVEAIKEARKSK